MYILYRAVSHPRGRITRMEHSQIGCRLLCDHAGGIRQLSTARGHVAGVMKPTADNPPRPLCERPGVVKDQELKFRVGLRFLRAYNSAP